MGIFSRDVQSWEQQSKRSCRSSCQSDEEHDEHVLRRQGRSLPGHSEPPKNSSGGPHHKPCPTPDGQEDQNHCSHHVQLPKACSNGTHRMRETTHGEQAIQSRRTPINRKDLKPLQVGDTECNLSTTSVSGKKQQSTRDSKAEPVTWLRVKEETTDEPGLPAINSP